MTKKMLPQRFLSAILCIGLLITVAVFAGLPQADATTVGGTYTGVVSSVQDGDTVHLREPLNAPAPVGGRTQIRLVGIDAPETFAVAGHPPGNQIIHGESSRSFLQSLLPAGTVITVVTDRVEIDGSGRVLGHVYRGALSVNREMLRQGHAVTYVRWPNTYSRFNDFRSALLEARTAGRGMWNPANPVQELPFEYRLRVFERQFAMFVGDFLTKTFVSPAEYRRVLVENRVKFLTQQDAISAGYRSEIPPSGLFINELLPAPRTTFTTEWIEIFNSTPQAIDLGGFRIDDIRNGGMAPFTIPSGTIIAANGFFVWRTNAFFNNDSDEAQLIAPNGTVVDSFIYSSTQRDASFRRLPDGGPWATTKDTTPTQGTSNR